MSNYMTGTHSGLWRDLREKYPSLIFLRYHDVPKGNTLEVYLVLDEGWGYSDDYGCPTFKGQSLVKSPRDEWSLSDDKIEIPFSLVLAFNPETSMAGHEYPPKQIQLAIKHGLEACGGLYGHVSAPVTIDNEWSAIEVSWDDNDRGPIVVRVGNRELDIL